MIREAIFSDETDSYAFPSEPCEGEDIRIRIRTALNDVQKVFFINRSKNRNIETRMEKVGCDRYFDYYELSTNIGSEELLYAFRLESGTETLYYDKLGVSVELRDIF